MPTFKSTKPYTYNTNSSSSSNNSSSSSNSSSSNSSSSNDTIFKNIVNTNYSSYIYDTLIAINKLLKEQDTGTNFFDKPGTYQKYIVINEKNISKV